MSDKMRIEEKDDVIVITCKGDLDAFYAEEFKEKALSLLASMEDTDVKKALVCYLDYVVEREK